EVRVEACTPGVRVCVCNGVCVSLPRYEVRVEACTLGVCVCVCVCNSVCVCSYSYIHVCLILIQCIVCKRKKLYKLDFSVLNIWKRNRTLFLPLAARHRWAS